MKITEQTIVGELVAKDYRAASVFKKEGIDFCCAGNKTIGDACAKKNIDPAVIIETLTEVTNKNSSAVADYNSWPLDLLADYVEKKHHRYVEEKIVEIVPFLNKVAHVHGQKHPELLEVLDLFRGCVEELTAHMQKEEQILFPFVRKIAMGEPVEAPFGSVQNPINMMMHEHTNEGERFRRIAALTANYTPPADACNTYRVTYALLKEFEEDLHLHIHIENNIMFPRAIAMEAKSKGKNHIATV
ncbi:iron-sulfur cluster repair di-iron protein [Pedobacter sp. UBA4863]|uniref:iron-sulfur cluster repair di-iron protein n=1 Tax=Pedobacter sp. UBA4863 TaxID=1947060 RepID=UPI0025E31C61|nr:iron-sulfur cluster repair di-iron protein [Pedobacter sp. UBA4863]